MTGVLEAKQSASAPAPDKTPWRPGNRHAVPHRHASGIILQKKCACGGTPGPSGECTECRRKRLKENGIQRHAHSPAIQRRTSGADSAPSQGGHTLGDVPVHAGTVEASPNSSAADPESILMQLGPGQPFAGTHRSRMESVFGQSFSQVRLHTDSSGGRMSLGLGAAAFTLGRHIAFAPGQYSPGTLIGDALLAHELAHVVQQRDADVVPAKMDTGTRGSDALERDADNVAAGVVAGLWGRTRAAAAGFAENTMPRLRSSMRVSMFCCFGCESSKTVDKVEQRLTSCDDICNMAYKDPMLNGGGGGVVCYYGTKCPCVFDVGSVKRGECPSLDAIVLTHEQRHVSEGECDASKIHRLGPKNPADLVRMECPHRRESIDLLDNAIANESEPCKSKLQAIRGGLDTWYRANCGAPAAPPAAPGGP